MAATERIVYKTLQLRRGPLSELLSTAISSGEAGIVTDRELVYIGNSNDKNKNRFLVGKVFFGTFADRPGNLPEGGILYHIIPGGTNVNVGETYLDIGDRWVKLSNSSAMLEEHLNNTVIHIQIDDNSISPNTTWSSEKINNLIPNSADAIRKALKRNWINGIRNFVPSVVGLNVSIEDKFVVAPMYAVDVNFVEPSILVVFGSIDLEQDDVVLLTNNSINGYYTVLKTVVNTPSPGFTSILLTTSFTGANGVAIMHYTLDPIFRKGGVNTIATYNNGWTFAEPYLNNVFITSDTDRGYFYDSNTFTWLPWYLDA